MNRSLSNTLVEESIQCSISETLDSSLNCNLSIDDFAKLWSQITHGAIRRITNNGTEYNSLMMKVAKDMLLNACICNADPKELRDYFSYLIEGQNQ